MDEQIKKGLVDAINGVFNFDGCIIEDKRTGVKIDCDEAELEVAVKANQYFDYHMVSYVLMNMIKDGKVEFCCDENDKDIRYLRKLLSIDKEE